jgi:glycosyltransferase involved in cell wall biosynthesis
MRALHVQKVKGIGGSERHLLTLLPMLVAHGIETRMCVLESGEGRRFVDELRATGVDVTAHPAGPDINPILVPTLAAEIRRYRPHVVHTHLIHADIVGQLAAASMRVPGVSSHHGTPTFSRREPYRTVGRVAGRLAARSIAISEHVANFIRELRLAPPERIRMIHYGVDTDQWAIGTSARAAARAALQLHERDVVVVIASRLVEGKGHDVLLDAFADAAAAGADHLTLLVAGDGPLRTTLEAQARRVCPPESVRFLGFVDDMQSILGAADLLVFPTMPELSEGFGLAALEAMACARPVIASAVGSLPEVVADGKTGILVPAGSVAALSAAISRLARDAALRTQLGHEGARRARQQFPLSAMVSRTVSVYDEVV